MHGNCFLRSAEENPVCTILGVKNLKRTEKINHFLNRSNGPDVCFHKPFPRRRRHLPPPSPTGGPGGGSPVPVPPAALEGTGLPERGTGAAELRRREAVRGAGGGRAPGRLGVMRGPR